MIVPPSVVKSGVVGSVLERLSPVPMSLFVVARVDCASVVLP